MKQINDILAFADDWMDEIEVQEYEPVDMDKDKDKNIDDMSR